MFRRLCHGMLTFWDFRRSDENYFSTQNLELENTAVIFGTIYLHFMLAGELLVASKDNAPHEDGRGQGKGQSQRKLPTKDRYLPRMLVEGGGDGVSGAGSSVYITV